MNTVLRFVKDIDGATGMDGMTIARGCHWLWYVVFLLSWRHLCCMNAL